MIVADGVGIVSATLTFLINVLSDMALPVFLNDPSGVASDQGIGPSGVEITSSKSKFRLCEKFSVCL